MSTSDPTRDLGEALAAAAAALATSDAPLAEAAVRGGLLACERLAARGAAPAAEELAALAALHGQVLARATVAREELREALERTGQSRRAASAYGRR